MEGYFHLRMAQLKQFAALLSTLLLAVEADAASLVINSARLAPDGVVLAGAGGSNSATFWLLATTNLSQPITNWSAVATNQFSAEGNFSLTNPLPPGSAQTFYRLQVAPTQPRSNNYNLFGFGSPATGGGLIPESDPNYRKVYTPGDLRLALANNNTKVIEIMNDLNLGWNEIGATNQTGRFRASAAASLHPALITSGVTTVDIQDKDGLTIFSANGAIIRHSEFNLKRAHNLLVRNLKFDELWEWDESSGTPGDYDEKDWDFITIGDGGACTNVWIDHCDFTKAYDGVLDIKGGYNKVTISWCRFLGDGGGPDSFVRKQFLYFETISIATPMYDFLRANGFSLEDIVAITRSQKKGHLVGATALSDANAGLKLTLHHNYYLNMQDRMPRLRAGNAHAYNLYVHNTAALAAKRLRATRAAAMNSTERGILNGDYSFDVTLNGAISTEDGAVLVEKCHFIDLTSPMRNNQTDPSNPAYTGKIRALDTIYTLDATVFRGDSEAAGSPLSPIPAAIKPFSWNGFTNLPYYYPLDEPAAVADMVTNSAGAGVLTWGKTNWLKTSY